MKAGAQRTRLRTHTPRPRKDNYREAAARERFTVGRNLRDLHFTRTHSHTHTRALARTHENTYTYTYIYIIYIFYLLFIIIIIYFFFFYFFFYHNICIYFICVTDVCVCVCVSTHTNWISLRTVPVTCTHKYTQCGYIGAYARRRSYNRLSSV